MKKYLVLIPDEGGDPVNIMTRDELNDLLSEGIYTIKQGEYTDSNYWKTYEIMIFELGEQVIPKVKMSV